MSKHTTLGHKLVKIAILWAELYLVTMVSNLHRCSVDDKAQDVIEMSDNFHVYFLLLMYNAKLERCSPTKCNKSTHIYIYVFISCSS